MKYLIIVLVLLISGCASKEERIAYYHAIQERDASVVHEYEQARNDRRAMRIRADLAKLDAFNRAMQATNNNAVAQVAIAMAFMGQIKQDTFVPQQVALTPIDQPDDASEILEAVSPLLRTGLIAGATAWGVSEVMDGLTRPTYQLQDSASVDINSDNASSFNSSGSNMNIDSITADGDGDDITSPPPDESINLEQCIVSPPGGFTPSGSPLWAPGCSCGSHFTDGTC